MAYEPGGQLSPRTDRKGQVSGLTHDALGRISAAGFRATTSAPTAYVSTLSLTWDTGDRLTQIVDSVSGTIARTYDELDRLTLETSPRGSVSYTYDPGSRPTSMTAQGTVTYVWDAADRLLQIQQAAGPINAGGSDVRV